MTKKQKNVRQNSLLAELSLLSAIIYLVLTTMLAIYSSSSSALTVEQEKSLLYLLKQDCGSCHGLTLQGGLGPALLKTNLEGKPLDYLVSVITDGLPGTPMPPWKAILDREQIEFIASYLLSDKNILINENTSTYAKEPPNLIVNQFSSNQKIQLQGLRERKSPHKN